MHMREHQQNAREEGRPSDSPNLMLRRGCVTLTVDSGMQRLSKLQISVRRSQQTTHSRDHEAEAVAQRIACEADGDDNV